MWISLIDERMTSDADRVAWLLSQGTWTHDYPITAREAKTIGLPISATMPPEVYNLMALYPQAGHRRPSVLSPVEYLRSALDIPRCHHEKWDGTGYPGGLHGEAIPLFARIFAVVDVWDAMRSDRPFRPALPADFTRDYVKEQAYVHFDPKVAEAFLALEPELS